MRSFSRIGLFSKQQDLRILDTLKELQSFLSKHGFTVLATKTVAGLLDIDGHDDDFIADNVDLAVVVGGFDVILLMQPFPAYRTDIGDHQAFGFDKSSRQEALDHGLGHVAASDESYFFTFQHNFFSSTHIAHTIFQ